MSETGGKARHRRGRRALRVGVPPALTTAVGLAYGTDFGVFGQDARQEAAAAGTAAWTDDVADGFASVDALGQKGTYGGRDGRTVTVRTQADPGRSPRTGSATGRRRRVDLRGLPRDGAPDGAATSHTVRRPRVGCGQRHREA
jgi:hypothetical protein